MFRKKYKDARAVLALAALTLSLLASASVASAADAPTRSQEVNLPNSKILDLTGELNAEGTCQVSLPDQGTREGFVEVGVELAFDEHDCTAQYAIAVYPLDSVPESVQQDVFGGTAEFSSFAEEPSSKEIAAAARSASGEPLADIGIMATHSSKLMIAYRDPVFIHVTRTTTTLNWTTAPPCVTGKSSDHVPYQVAVSGWIRTSYTPSSSFTCSEARADTVAKFKNDKFCVGQPTTYSNHLQTLVRGYPSGSSNWSRNMTKSGGCNGLLHSTYGWTP